jgi:sulfur carrier protein
LQIVFNGEPRDVEAETTVARLLEQAGVNPRQVAVEVNLELAPRAGHATRRLAPGDRVEVVSLVGGG